MTTTDSADWNGSPSNPPHPGIASPERWVVGVVAGSLPAPDEVPLTAVEPDEGTDDVTASGVWPALVHALAVNRIATPTTHFPIGDKRTPNLDLWRENVTRSRADARTTWK